VRGRGTQNKVRRAAYTLTHRNPKPVYKGALEQWEVPPPLQSTPSRRRRYRPRHRRPCIDLTASLVAAFERISISEQGMAGSNSSGGAEGFSTLFLSMCFP